MVLGVSQEIQKIKSYHYTDYPILTVYLSIPQTKNYNKLLTNSFKKLTGKLSGKDCKDLENDIQYVSSFLEKYKNIHEDKGIALFSGGNKLWEVINTPFSFQERIYCDHSPHLAPLMKKLEQFERYLVVLADRQKARFFTLYNGKVESEATIKDPSVPQKVRANEERYYGRSDKISRHIQDHLHRHLKLISEKLDKFIEGKPISGVIVGGHNTLIHKTEKYLPRQLKGKVLAEFISELNISLTDLAQRSAFIIQNIHNNSQPRLITR